MAAEDSWWHYFERVDNSLARCKVEECKWIKDQGPSKSTSNLKHHLLTKHPELYKKYTKAKSDKEEKIKNKSVNQPKLSFSTKRQAVNENQEIVPAKRPNSAQEQPTISQSFTQWTQRGEKNNIVNKAFMDMICVDGLPLAFGDKIGFRNFCKTLEPRWKISSRKYYTDVLLTEMFEKMKNRITEDLKEVNHISLTADLWSSNDYKHSLLGITAHFITNDCNPGWLVFGCVPIDDLHKTGKIIAEKLSGQLKLLSVPNEKVHVLVRDAENIIETAKKIVRKINKSGLNREYLKKLQESFNLPNTTLKKGLEFRWNSTFTMVESLYKNKEAIILFSDSREAIQFNKNKLIPKLTSTEWEKLRKIIDLLRSLHTITKEMQGRNMSASSIIPFYSWLKNELKKTTDDLDTDLARTGMIERLENLMEPWKRNKNLVLATLLDPRYKLRFFERSDLEDFRSWGDDHQEVEDYDIEYSDGLNQLSRYLHEPVIGIRNDPLAYWRKNKEKYSNLFVLVKKYLSSPPSSSEAERLFSTAGYINFYKIVLNYIERWFQLQLLPKGISIINLENKELIYAEVVQLAEQICPENSENDELFDEVSQLNKTLNGINEEDFYLKTTEQKWKMIFDVSGATKKYKNLSQFQMHL
uniref:BED-type domain-containing protein n=1 Tax=Meloidogyne floridensis TaxID=298350 RepID=A0A915NVT9_9BILA